MFMKIKESKMEKNLYNKMHSEDWMVLPSLSGQKGTTYVDVHDLVLYPKSLFDNIDRKDRKMDVNQKDFSDIFADFC